METMDGRLTEDIIDECVQRLLEGESLDDVLMSHPGMGAQLLPALEPAIALLQTPLVEPSLPARNAAMHAMLRQVREEAARPAPAGVFAWLGSLRARPLAFQSLAVAGALVLFGGLGIGASAATGTTPAPVRSFFRISSESEQKVHLSGAVVSAGDGSLVIRTESGDRTLLLTASTVIDRGGQNVGAADLHVGEEVEVTGVERADGGLTARQVHAKPAPEPSAAPPLLPAGDDTPGAAPTADASQDDDGSGADGRRDGDREQPENSPTHEADDATHEPDDDATPAEDSTPESEGHDSAVTRTPEHEAEDHPKTPEPSETKSPESHDSSDDGHPDSEHTPTP